MGKIKKFFGTDGIRGAVGTYPVTPDFMLRLGWATGKVFAETGGGKVLIGKDTRVSGYMLESALEAGLTSAGMDINLLGPMPTPAVAYLTRTFHAQAGIVISASHNPYHDNGIKFFSGKGTKLDDEVELAIEKMLDQDISTVDSRKIGKASRISDASGRYIEFCKSTVDSNIKLDGLKILVDCANGATYHIAPNVFDELGANVTAIANKPDGFNINEACGSTCPQGLADKVLAQNADLGIAFDGDGDRVVMVDHTGAIVDGDELLYIIACHDVGTRRGSPGVVGTVMSNLGLEVALQKRAIPFARTRVGDRFVMAELEKRRWTLGGESSGHIICLTATSTGDGIISALQVLAAMKHSGKSLHELKSGMEKYPQTMINVSLKNKARWSGNTRIESAVQEVETTLAGKGRVLLRSSGTEPLIRVMVEGNDSGLVARLARELSDVVAAEVS
ncbi:MAG: phosphoglucosamine mutase [Pseudomonadales bacterium]|nr:phosphoglucosamine mutase [Pseudomonadales bacterium]